MLRLSRFNALSVTTRLLLILCVVALGIALVYAFARRGLQHTGQELRHLANVEMEELLNSTRLVQQSEMVASYAHLVTASRELSERRRHMMELNDRMLWLDKLVNQVAAGIEPREDGSQLLRTRHALQQTVSQLSQLVFNPSAQAQDDAQIKALGQDSHKLGNELSMQASHLTAELRRDINNRGQLLAQDVAHQQVRLTLLVLGLLVIVLVAGWHIDASVSKRLKALRREVRKDELGALVSQVSSARGDEIDQLTMTIASYKRHLNKHANAARSAVRAKNRFLAGASHDLRQPVQALNLFLETLRGSGLNQDQSRLLEHALAALAASREMLDTLMDYSRIEAGVLQAQSRAVAVAPLMRRIEKEFGPQADAKGLVFRVHDSEEWVHTDATLLFMMLRNLVSNALRYTDSGGVLIGLRQRRTQRCIEVWDTGIGIDAANHELIFQEFHQIEEASGLDGRGKGMGLGLAIVRELADMINATISVASRPGRGSVFRVTLAAGQRPADALRLNPDMGEPDPDTHRLLPGLRVLVVDDDPLVRASLCAMLEQWQCLVVAAATVTQVERLLARAMRAGSPPWEVVITDLRLARLENGGQVILAVQEAIALHAPWREHPPEFFILTGDTAPDQLQIAAALGAVLMHKPIEPRVMNAQLGREWVRRARERAGQ